MDEDIQHILNVFPKKIQDKWTEKESLHQYILKLGANNADELVKETQRLNEESSEVSRQTQDLALNNYKTFIQTAENSRKIFKEFQNLECEVENVIEKFPKFQDQCDQFSSDSNEINIHRNLTALTFFHNAQMMEILELPTLMEQSISNDNYEDALEIVHFVRRLVQKNSNIKVFNIVSKEIESLWLTMVHQLLSQLRTDIQLPKCLQTIGYLRCMNIFSEAELRLKFLQARDSWLQNLLNDIPKDKANQHLSKTIELSRIHIFHIITQYKAIFSDEPISIVLKKDFSVNETAIFQSWIHEKVSQFIKTLDQDMASCESSTYSSTLSQCMYFGLSFSRVCSDFRGLIEPLITKYVFENYRKLVQRATKKFKKDMECYTLINKINVNTVKKSNIDSDQKLENLQDFSPLAEYCNGLLIAFNDLRICAPLSLIKRVTQTLQESLISVSEVILLFYQQEHQAFSSTALELFSCFCKCFAYELLPHIEEAIHKIYPFNKLSVHLGISVQTLEKSKLAVLDKSSILKPILHLLPVIETVVDENEDTDATDNSIPSEQINNPLTS